LWNTNSKSNHCWQCSNGLELQEQNSLEEGLDYLSSFPAKLVLHPRLRNMYNHIAGFSFKDQIKQFIRLLNSTSIRQMIATLLSKGLLIKLTENSLLVGFRRM
jgi:hypothetical protein